MSTLLDVVAWICVKDQQVLCARTRGNRVFYFPGGKRQPAESDWDATAREVHEELRVQLCPETFCHLITLTEKAHGHGEHAQVTMRCFEANYTGIIQASSEIEEIAWLGYAERDRCAPATAKVMDYLRSHARL